MTMQPFNIQAADHTWQPILQQALHSIDQHYLNHLYHSKDWLPGPEQIFNAFSLPMTKVNYVLFGESPYPRKISANGYAFWDAAVKNLWSKTGMSKEVNRATSLRNFLKMLLVAEGLLDPKHTNQAAIAAINKDHLIQTNTELFQRLLQHGFLLLNTTPVLQADAPKKDARAWQGFTQIMLEKLLKLRPNVTLLFFGAIAQNLSFSCVKSHENQLHAEHPYNITFIENPVVLNFFKPLHLLSSVKKDKVRVS